MRDLKRHTSEQLHKAIQNNKTESRREWMLWMMERPTGASVLQQAVYLCQKVLAVFNRSKHYLFLKTPQTKNWHFFGLSKKVETVTSPPTFVST